LLTVLIATYNGAATLPGVLQAYCALSAPAQGWRLLVVDNGSSDGSSAVVAGFADRLPLRCLHEGRRGKNVALNTALAGALEDSGTGSDLFVFSDDDAAPEPDWLLRLSACAEAHRDYAIFGGAIFADWAVKPSAWVTRLVPLGLTYAITDPALPDGPVFAGLVWGANMALRRAVFDAGYRFDEAVGPNGGAYAMGSETLMTRRLADAGYRSWFCPQARVGHFIRPYQLDAAYVLQRAYRFGRGKFRQDARGLFPTLLRVPRWMWPRFAIELAGAARAWLRRDRDRLFLHRWEMHYLSGYLHEAWIGRKSGHNGAAPRVLITSYSGELGGMELRMGQEARVLAAAGYQALLATRSFPGFDGWAESLRSGSIDVSVFDPPRFFEQWRWRRWNYWRARFGGMRQLRRYRADLVHVAFCWNTYGASALWLARRCRLPAVISVHNAFPPAELDRWYWPLLREAFLSVRGIYAVSESAMQHFLALYQDYIPPATRLAVIPNSVDLRRFAPSPQGRAAARLRLGLPKGALVLGSVARLSPQKRPQAVLRLFCAVSAILSALPGFPDLYLVFVGGGPLEAALRRQAENAGLGKRILFTGYSGAVETLLPAFDLHLLLSRNEGFGIATIEAMACGVPAVGTDVPGTADILRGSRGGLLVPLADETAAAAEVAALLRDRPRRSEMARCARAEMEAGYADARLQKQVLDFYRGLL
jgi:glycosyltransferase involved in cell wall biosynthesis